MLKITVSRDANQWDDEKQEFLPEVKEHTLTLEHSLLSVSKWEAIYHLPFLSTELDLKMIKDYARCMTINPNVPDEVFDCLTADDITQIANYIKDSATATWFRDDAGNKTTAAPKGKMRGKVITNELVYCWMTQLQIPFTCEKWHLNRLLTLIRVISVENDPKGSSKKMTGAERRALNKARQAKYHTRG